MKSDVYRSLAEEIQIFIESYDRENTDDRELIEGFTCMFIEYQNNFNKDNLLVYTKYFNSNEYVILINKRIASSLLLFTKMYLIVN